MSGIGPHIEAPLVGSRPVDGDTLIASLGVKVRVRLAGIDAPELSKPDQKLAAIVARVFLTQWFDESDRHGWAMQLRADSIDVYGRIVGDIYRPISGESLTAYLLESGVVVRSEEGGRRHQWTIEELQRIESLLPHGAE